MLEQSRAEYRTIFNECPVAIWEEDFSAAARYVKNKKAQGVMDIRGRLADHPEEVENLAGAIKITDINEAALNMYRAGSREELEAGLPRVFGPKTYDVFRDEIESFAAGQTVFTGSTVNETLTGEELRINLKMCIVPGCEDDWSRVLVFITARP